MRRGNELDRRCGLAIVAINFAKFLGYYRSFGTVFGILIT